MADWHDNDDFARTVQQQAAMPVYQRFWDVEQSDIEEVDQQNRDGDALAQLLDKGGVDKIIQLKGNLMLAQRIRRPEYDSVDFTIRRQAKHDWNAEYTKLKESYLGNGTTPSKYIYGQATKQLTGFQSLYVVNLDGFLELEFSNKLAKIKSPSHHDQTDDPYYWENSGDDDNGFYAWSWLQLKQNKLVEAELVDGKLVSIGVADEHEPTAEKPDRPHDITEWADN